MVIVALVLALSSGAHDATSPSGSAFVGPDLHSLVVDPTSPQRLYLGGHQAVAMSNDGGTSWRSVKTLRDADAMGWAFRPDEVWVSGHPGLNRSHDGGRTFLQVNAGLPNTDVHAFGAGRNVLYGASPAVGVFASLDGGVTWETRSRQSGQAFFGRILVDTGDETHLVAAGASAGRSREPRWGTNLERNGRAAFGGLGNTAGSRSGAPDRIRVRWCLAEPRRRPHLVPSRSSERRGHRGSELIGLESALRRGPRR